MEQDDVVLYRAVGHNELEQMEDTGTYTVPTELETLLRRHLPEDTDPGVTDRVVDQWKTSLATATRVIVVRVDDYGPKLQASWLDREGRIVASIARPFPRESSVRRFVRHWERYMHGRGVRAPVSWNEATGPESKSGATS